MLVHAQAALWVKASIRDIVQQLHSHTALIDHATALHSLSTWHSAVIDSSFKCPYLKSLGLAKPLAPIGPRSGSVK
jgi:hypothetical protein